MRRTAIAMAALLVFGSCSAIRTQKAAAPAPDGGEFHNLKALPANITRAQLRETMRGFTRALNVHCDHCHQPVSDPKDPNREFDFAADTKPAKEVARTMIRMVQTINRDYISRVNNPTAQNVTCMTCHRGATVPQVPAAAEQPPQQKPS